MPYNAQKLITNAYYTSGIVAREFQQVSGTQVYEGLDYLNELLTDKRVDNAMLSYYTKYTFNTVAGQEVYVIPGLVKFDTLVFFLSNVRYEMKEAQRIEYFGTSRAENIQSLPIMYHVERQLDSANVYLYFVPNQVYVMEGWGLFGLTQVVLTTDLTLTYDQFYISYLKYALAARICINYDYDIPDNVQKQLDWYEGIISKQSQEMDLKLQKISTLSSNQSLNYAQINIGKSWTVP
ncbi:MAG: hypothetical protein V4568_18055 [Pseudomonadota bacterium]